MAMMSNWSMISSDWEDEVAEALLQMIIDEYIKIHGHSIHSLALGWSSTRGTPRNKYRSPRVYENNSYPNLHRPTPVELIPQVLQRIQIKSRYIR